jgi:hypothetical protein
MESAPQCVAMPSQPNSFGLVDSNEPDDGESPDIAEAFWTDDKDEERI